MVKKMDTKVGLYDLELKKFENCIRLKAELIVNGIQVEKNIAVNNKFNTKQIHLYQHHETQHTFDMPEDLVLYSANEMIPQFVVSKLRYNPESDWILNFKDGYKLHHYKKGIEFSVTPSTPTGFENHTVAGAPLSTIVQKLGIDVAGVIISNYCFYFKNKKECRFCEIFQTHKVHKTFTKSIKKSEEVVEALKLAFQLDPELKFILLNSGNIVSYDQTNLKFIEIAKGINDLKKDRNLDLIGILMPPDQFHLIDDMKEAGFDKVYYDIEVFDEDLFKVIVPGKADYGYKKMLDALIYAKNVFGKGSSYSSFIYGIQSLSHDFNTSNWSANLENQKALIAVDGLLEKEIVPLFCVYHYSGYNQIGKLHLDADALFEFSYEYGKRVHLSGIIPKSRDSVVYRSTSVTNTLLNDGYNLAKLNSSCLI